MVIQFGAQAHEADSDLPTLACYYVRGLRILDAVLATCCAESFGVLPHCVIYALSGSDCTLR